MSTDINNLLSSLLDQFPGLSDVHLSQNKVPAVRFKGEIIMSDQESVTEEDFLNFFSQHMTKKELEKYLDEGDMDFAVQVENNRFRANSFTSSNGHNCVLRVIVSDIPDIKVLNLPKVVEKVLNNHAGLILVTGQTGSGKSTSLAAMIDSINSTRQANIITIEDPIEFMHQNKKSIISQREVGRDTQSFARAIKAALREDPDIILLGELRDYETISLALTAAETGHLVFGTLHTSGASSTINRIIDAYPPQEQAQARSQLSTSLQMVLTQRLFKKKDGSGRIGAFEVMVCNSAIRNLIRESKIPQIDQAIETGASDGMINMKKYIENLVNNDLINQPKDIE